MQYFDMSNISLNEIFSFEVNDSVKIDGKDYVIEAKIILPPIDRYQMMAKLILSLRGHPQNCVSTFINLSWERNENRNIGDYLLPSAETEDEFNFNSKTKLL